MTTFHHRIRKHLLLLFSCFMLTFPPLLHAYSIENILTPEGKTLLRLHVYQPGETSPAFDGTTTATRALPQAELAALKQGVLYYHALFGDQILGAVPVIDLVPLSDEDDNASAYSPFGSKTQTTLLTDAFLRGLSPQEALTPQAIIEIDRTSPVSTGWYTEALPVLPLNGMKSDLPGTMLHEMFHALGLSSSADSNSFTENSKWDQGLRDYYGTAAQAGMQIKALPTGGTSDREAFYILKNAYGGAYFTGRYVDAVLNGARLIWPDDSRSPAVPGLPVNGFEDKDADLSHLELQNSLMSHQNYRNWCTLMEAEIAVLQDLGYSIDRRQFFGNSIYGSGTAQARALINNTAPFYARNMAGDGWLEGVANPQEWGIGLHVYGSWNDVHQQADLLSSGTWGMGIRVDGTGNALTIEPGIQVQANGYGGNALLVSYGRDHQITSRGDLQALGAGGVAARFDFGSNEMGDHTEYRGSYIRTQWDEDASTWINGSLLSALNGPLVSHFNVTGTLAGSAAAIYISPNAFVQHIDIMQGAYLQGDIISAWNPANPLYSGMVVQAPAGADLTTELAFGRLAAADGTATAQPDPSFALRYDGSIKGATSLRMTLAGGLLSFNGSADVLSADVAEQAIFAGNNTLTLSGGTGIFTNAGFVAPGNSLGVITINGNYVQTTGGHLAAEFNALGTSDRLIVNGDAQLSGSLDLIPVPDYYTEPLSIDPLTVSGSLTRSYTTNLLFTSPTLSMTALTQADGSTQLVSSRSANAYSQYADNQNAASVGDALVAPGTVGSDMRALYGALDFSAPNGSIVREALNQLAPNAYGNAALASFNTHRMLSELLLPGLVAPASPRDGEWHLFALPYGGTFDQPAHQGSGGYNATNVGLIGGADRRTLGGLTLGGHVVFNHQSMTGDTNGKLHGEGLYLGARSLYAPAAWNGWNIFGVGRVGIENWRMKRAVSFNGYTRENSQNWTGLSGTLRAGGACDFNYETFRLSPFVSLDYAFSTRPSLTEESGLGSRLHLNSTTFHSLRSSLGLRLTTPEQPLGAHATWKVHTSAAWNHELLNKAGTMHASFVEATSAAFTNTVKAPGRDSLGLNAGITFNTDQNLSFALNAGSELFQHKGSSVYGNLALEWKF